MAPSASTENIAVEYPKELRATSSQEAAAIKQELPISPPAFDDKYKEREYLKGRLAAAFRIFGKYGFDEGVAGHITLRDPVNPHTFWVNPFGVAFSLIKASDLIQVDHSGNVVGGGPCKLVNVSAFLIHSAVHAERPDVMCAAHSHSIYGRSFSALGKPIDFITQDSCAFYDVRYRSEYPHSPFQCNVPRRLLFKPILSLTLTCLFS
jgi:hypothetical protein